MRAAVNGLCSPYSLADLLPSVYQEDPFTIRFTAGWDDVIAPVISTLDCLAAYLDPKLAPEDILEWLADRIGAPLDEKWSLERKRHATARALTGHRAHGTAAEVRKRIALATDGEVELFESGGVYTSRAPGVPFPDHSPSTVLVRVTVRQNDAVGLAAVDAVMQQCMPAHIPYRTEVARR
ncbi:phage tail protein [Streptomyces sp. NPDC019539]|uniref:phage tail protein n=1 Tax=Streptomyces sp. NPDC019539 TaxID=3365063 RepID=UPI0037A11EFA